MSNDIAINTSQNLSTRVSKSTFWLTLFQVLDNVLGFLRLIILARLLSPKDFGLVGVAWLIILIVNTFTQTGIQQTLIHKPHIEKYLNTAWTYLLVRGFIIFIVIFVFAPLLGTFFNASSAVSVIRAIGLSFAFEGCINIGVIYFQKDLSFNKQFIFQISGNIVDFFVAIIAALVLHNVWAIVLGTLANNLFSIFISYILSTYRPRFEFKRNLFKEMNNYGKWIAGSNILQFIYSSGDDLLISKVLGITSLGLYQLAYRISNLPATQITHLVSTVMFPAYSKIQTERERVSKIYLSVLQVVTFLSFFIGTIIIIFSYDFTELFLGKKWLMIVPAMQILTIWGVIRSIGATTGPVWQALGTPKIVTKIQLLQVVIMVVIIYPFTRVWNIEGTATAVVIAALIPNIIAISLISKTIHCRITVIIMELVYPLVSSIITIAIYGYVRFFVIKEMNFFIFFLLAILCSLVYLLNTFFLHKLLGYSVFKNIFALAKSILKEKKYVRILTKLEVVLR